MTILSPHFDCQCRLSLAERSAEHLPDGGGRRLPRRDAPYSAPLFYPRPRTPHPGFDTLYYDDIDVGYRYEIRAPKEPPFGIHEVTVEEIIAFGRLWDPRPQHTDPEAARATDFGGLIASGAHTFSLWTRLALEAAAVNEPIAIIAGLGSELRMPAPMRPGDVFGLKAEIVDKRLSASRPGTGIVTTDHEMSNQRGLVVFQNRAITLVERRSMTR